MTALLTGACLLALFWSVAGALLLVGHSEEHGITLRAPRDAEETILCGPLLWGIGITNVLLRACVARLSSLEGPKR